MNKLSGIFAGVAATAALSALTATIAAAAAMNLMREGFCVAKSAHGCGEVALPGTMIEFAHLPKLPDGTPILYFYSRQKISAKTTFVHILESEEAASHIDYIFPAETQNPADPLKNALKALVKKLAPEGGVTVTPFHFDAASTEQSVTTSYIRVTGPGAYSAKVLDLKGDPIPGSQPISVNVIQNR